MSIAAILILGVLSQEPAGRPPRPTDAAMLAKLFEERPSAQILSVNFTDTPLGGGRSACGLIDFNGTVEPFALLAGRRDHRPGRVSSAGSNSAEWVISDIAPKHLDYDEDGQIGRFDRNLDTLHRKMALITCRENNPINPPENVTWVLESEPDPDRSTTTVTPGSPPRIMRVPTPRN